MRNHNLCISVATCCLAFACVLVDGTRAAYSYPRPTILGTTRYLPLTGASLRVERVRGGDTLTIQAAVVCDAPLANGRWEVELPNGMAHLAGELQGATLALALSGNYAATGRALVRVEHFGNFEILIRAYADKDSATWSSLEYKSLVRVTPDSFLVISPCMKESFRQQAVVDGVHYGTCLTDAIPLDPGEDEQTGPIRPFDGTSSSPPATYKKSAKRFGASGKAAAVEIPIRVAVDHSGRVKAAGVSGLHHRAPTPDEQAALEAAWKWRFSPTMSKGRPVTALYLIRVPVTNADSQ